MRQMKHGVNSSFFHLCHHQALPVLSPGPWTLNLFAGLSSRGRQSRGADPLSCPCALCSLKLSPLAAQRQPHASDPLQSLGPWHSTLEIQTPNSGLEGPRLSSPYYFFFTNPPRFFCLNHTDLFFCL